VINNRWRADPVDGTGREDQKRGDKEPRPVEITNDELRGFIDRAGVVDQTGAESLVVIMRHLLNEAYRAGREDAAREMAQKIIDHANRYAPLDGNIQQRRMRRHLMIAVQVVSPKPSLEEVAAAVARGDYVACHLDEYGQPVDQPGVQPTEEQRAHE
jgi:hypothetical protein